MTRELEPREKKLMMAAGIGFAVFILYMLIISGGGPDRTANVDDMERSRDQLIALIRDYNELKDTIETVDKKIDRTPDDFDLIGEISGIGESVGISPKGISPHDTGGNEFYDESYVNMQINDVTLQELVGFLQKIEETPAFLRVSKLTVKRKTFKSEEESLLDVNIRVAVYMKKMGEQ